MNTLPSNPDIDLLEQWSHQNGSRYWLAHEFLEHLGYTSWDKAKGVINRAIASCSRLDIDVAESFTQVPVVIDGREQVGYKLNRFACFLVVMHADDKKPQVQRAKVALSALAEGLLQAALEESSVPRIDTRAELSNAEKIMAAAAKQAGVESSQFGIFKDAGFRGMYNMSLADLRNYKGLKTTRKTPPVLYDYMGLTELAGNLFRVTQTSERMKAHHVQGLSQSAKAAEEVGREVRNMMIKNSGEKPENLPLEEDIKSVKNQLRRVSRGMIKHDKSTKKS